MGRGGAPKSRRICVMRSRYSSTAELWQYRRRVVEANWLPQDVKEQFVLFYGLNGLEYAGLGRKVSSFGFGVSRFELERVFGLDAFVRPRPQFPFVSHGAFLPSFRRLL